ncbi:hypothetical protein [Rubellicoccus peritrichatus]|uniref:PEP-CTERM protein-sorting domain-containing protein n=1 Tax=Rubellicoccus peritrichatus TaxID=3080537 RepID=A0AAQ3QV87_9BACT|nr:hypothetical protein [Puniceicoccus sp. CR14]WOO43201.1 hypothetical protein RZN69_08850 [Puniceicoccus sp. CR14]
MKSSGIRFAMLFALSAICGTQANAALNYSVDTTNKLFILDGSATGTPFDLAGTGALAWGVDDIVGSDIDIDFQSSFTGTADSSSSTITTVGFRAEQGLASGRSIAFSLALDNASSTTITLSNVTFDYSGFNATNIASIDALASSQETLLLMPGTGFGNITYSPIPEPAYYASAFALGLLALAHARRVINKKR